MNFRVLNLKIVLFLTVVLSLSFIMLNTSWAQTDGSDSKIQSKASNIEIDLNRKVTLDADDAFLPTVLSILAQQSGYNIVTGPGVDEEKKLSIHLKETPIGEAINLAVRACGLSYEIVGQSFLVAETDILKEVAEVGLQPYLISLQYAKADEVKILLKDLTDKVQVDASSNSLLVTTTPRVIDEIHNIIETVDVPPLQIMMEARIVELSTAASEKYGIDWSKLSNLTTILAEDYYFNGQGVPPGAELTPGADVEHGSIDAYASSTTGALPDEMYFQKLDGFNNIGHFSRQLTAFDVTLDFLLKNNLAKVVANTRLTTMNNRVADIIIGETVPYFVITGVGANQERTTEKESVGTKLNVLPTVNKEGYITLEITPEVSNIVEMVGGQLPRTRVRRATTTVIAKDGQQILVGGFLQTDEYKTEHKLPFFGNLPFVGKFFRHKSIEETQVELMIEITPHILVNGEPIDGDSLLDAYPLLKADKEMRETVEEDN